MYVLTKDDIRLCTLTYKLSAGPSVTFAALPPFSGGALTTLTQTGIALRSEVNVMDTSIGTKQNDFAEMDNAGITKKHWKIMLISGMGFFTTPMIFSSSASLWHCLNPCGTWGQSKRVWSSPRRCLLQPS